MQLHLIKLAVGCDSVKELKEWVAERMQTAKKKGLPQHHIHITRMVPKRLDDLLGNGSLYWVIKGQLACRQRLVAIRPFTDADGIGRDAARIVGRRGRCALRLVGQQRAPGADRQRHRVIAKQC